MLFHTDDPKQSVSVTITADVRQRIHITPRFVPLGRFKRDKGTEATVYVWASDGKPFKVKGTRFTRMSGFKDGEIKIDEFITFTMPLEDINRAFDLMHEGKSIRSVIHF